MTKAETAGRVDSGVDGGVIAPERLACLRALEKKILWLSRLLIAAVGAVIVQLLV